LGDVIEASHAFGLRWITTGAHGDALLLGLIALLPR
jgi:hypothetical protein